MKKKIHLINYGFGNPASVKNALEFLNYNCKVVDHNTNLSDITHLILPGVGSFEAGIKTLQKQKNVLGCPGRAAPEPACRSPGGEQKLLILITNY